MYFEQASEQVYKKKLWWQTDQGVKTPQSINHRGVSTARCRYFAQKKNSDFKIIHRVICIHNRFPGKEYTRESIRIPKLGNFQT